MTLADIILLLLLAAAVAASVLRMIKHRGKKCSGCGCSDCSRCKLTEEDACKKNSSSL